MSSIIFARSLHSVNLDGLTGTGTARPVFDCDGALDSLVVGYQDGFAVAAGIEQEPPAWSDFDPFTLVDPTLDDAQVPAEPVNVDPVDPADRAWLASEVQAARDAAAALAESAPSWWAVVRPYRPSFFDDRDWLLESAAVRRRGEEEDAVDVASMLLAEAA